jgi:hypothetical protein
LFGAVCPERGTGAAVVLPACNSEAMQLHLDEIATQVAPGAHAILILDQAGWHGSRELRVPANISLLPLPPRSPELNSQENIRQFMRQNWLSNRVFKSFDEHRRSLLLRLEYAHRPAMEDHVHRPARLGSRRSLVVKIGIATRIVGAPRTHISAFHIADFLIARWVYETQAPWSMCHLEDDRIFVNFGIVRDAPYSGLRRHR